MFIDGVPDGKAKSKNKNGKFITDDSYYIGGGPNSFNYDGFQGCIDGVSNQVKIYTKLSILTIIFKYYLSTVM